MSQEEKDLYREVREKYEHVIERSIREGIINNRRDYEIDGFYQAPRQSQKRKSNDESPRASKRRPSIERSHPGASSSSSNNEENDELSPREDQLRTATRRLEQIQNKLSDKSLKSSRQLEKRKNLDESSTTPNKRQSDGAGQKQASENKNCFTCGQPGHKKISCPNKHKGPLCYNCKKYGHLGRNCWFSIGFPIDKRSEQNQKRDDPQKDASPKKNTPSLKNLPRSETHENLSKEQCEKTEKRQKMLDEAKQYRTFCQDQYLQLSEELKQLHETELKVQSKIKEVKAWMERLAKDVTVQENFIATMSSNNDQPVEMKASSPAALPGSPPETTPIQIGSVPQLPTPLSSQTVPIQTTSKQTSGPLALPGSSPVMTPVQFSSVPQLLSPLSSQTVPIQTTSKQTSGPLALPASLPVNTPVQFGSIPQLLTPLPKQTIPIETNSKQIQIGTSGPPMSPGYLPKSFDVPPFPQLMTTLSGQTIQIQSTSKTPNNMVALPAKSDNPNDGKSYPQKNTLMPSQINLNQTQQQFNLTNAQNFSKPNSQVSIPESKSTQLGKGEHCSVWSTTP